MVRLIEVFESRSELLMVAELCDGCEIFEEISTRDRYSECEAAEALQ